METKIPVKQLSVISLLVATGVVVRSGLGWLAYVVPAFYGVLIKVGLSETLAFICGFVFGPIQGFIASVLIIIVSDMFSIYGPGLWTPFIASIIGLVGIGGWMLHRFKENPSVISMGVAAVILTIVSELLQNIWFAWYMWAFYMPETTFMIVLGMSLVGGIKSMVTALINNTVLFTAVAPRIIKVLQEMVMPKENKRD
jgi:hypothetical protein